jgi:hypothetical protein
MIEQTACPLDNAQADAQTFAAITLGIVYLKELLENVLMVTRGDTNPTVAHLNAKSSAVVRRSTGDKDRALPGVPDGVAD